MKKLFLFLSLLMFAGLSAQTPSLPITKLNNIQITNPVSGSTSDKVLVRRDSDGIARTIDTKSITEDVSKATINYDIADNTSALTGSTYYAFPVLLNSQTNKKILIYRKGTGHIGNDGILEMRVSTDGGKNFASPVTIASQSGVDCRNASAGVTYNGRIIVFFLKYNATTSAPISQGYIYSDNEGSTWSNYQTIDNGTGLTFFSPYRSIINIGSGKILMSWYGNDGSTGTNYVKISSDNGTTWGASIQVQTAGGFRWDETTYAYLDGGVIVGMARNGSGGSTFHQVISLDNGSTWADQGAVNFGASASVSPQLSTYIDIDGNKYVVCFYAQRISTQKLYSIIASKTSILAGSTGWVTQSLTEVGSNTIDDFGYPSVVNSRDGKKFLGVYYKASDTSNSNLQFFNLTLPSNALTFYNNVNARFLRTTRIGAGTHLLHDNGTGNNRWAWQLQVAESGGNTGSELWLEPLDDTNVGLGALVSFHREAKLSNFNGELRASGSLRLIQSVTSNYPSLGTFNGSFQVKGDSNAYGLDSGVYGDGNIWIQAHRSDGTATAYNIVLQPSGGKLLVSTSTDSGSGAKLQVNGSIEASATNGIILTDTVSGTKYKIQVTSGVITVTALP